MQPCMQDIRLWPDHYSNQIFRQSFRPWLVGILENFRMTRCILDLLSCHACLLSCQGTTCNGIFMSSLLLPCPPIHAVSACRLARETFAGWTLALSTCNDMPSNPLLVASACNPDIWPHTQTSRQPVTPIRETKRSEYANKYHIDERKKWTR